MSSHLIFAKPLEKWLVYFLTFRNMDGVKLNSEKVNYYNKEVLIYKKEDTPDYILAQCHSVAVWEDEHCYYVLVLMDLDHYEHFKADAK